MSAPIISQVDRRHGYESGAPCPRKPIGSEWEYVGVVPVKDLEVRHGWQSGPLQAISSLINAEMPDGRGDVGPQWLVSFTYKKRRATDKQVRRALKAFGLEEAEEDNHHPGSARAFFLVVDPQRRVDCQCKADEDVIVEPDGYRWSNPKPGSDEGCRGCDIAPLTGRPCPLHPTAPAETLGERAAASLRPKLMPADTPDIMAPAWAACLRWAIGEDEIRAAFETATGNRWSAPRSGLDQMIDEATGAGRAYVEAFIPWFNENVWGAT